MQHKSGKFISLGLIITIVGWLLIMGCCYVGLTLAGCAPLLVIVSTALAALIGAVSMFFLVRSKTSVADMRNWLTVRIVSLIGAFAVVAYVAVPAIYTVNYVLCARAIGNAAIADVDSVATMWSTFRSYEHERASRTLSGLRNFSNSGTSEADAALTAYLRDYLSQQPGTVGEQTLASFSARHDAMIDALQIGSISWNDGYAATLAVYQADAAGLSPAAFRNLRMGLEPFAGELASTLTRQSHSMQLPLIATRGGSAYSAYNDSPRDYAVTPVTFAAAYDKIFVISWQGIVLYALIVFLYFFLFIFSYSTKVNARDNRRRLSSAHGVKL